MDADANANANANADAGGSTIALPERCSGELINEIIILNYRNNISRKLKTIKIKFSENLKLL